MMTENKAMETATPRGQLDRIVMPRFIVEERSGIIAIYDTHHQAYRNTPGCHADYPWVVAAWYGEYNKERSRWEIRKWKIEKAYQLASLLNGETT